MIHKSSISNVKQSRFYWNLTISTSSDFYALSITMFNSVPWKTVFNLSRNKKPQVNCIKYQFHFISSDTRTNRLYVSVIYSIFLFNRWYMKRKKCISILCVPMTMRSGRLNHTFIFLLINIENLFFCAFFFRFCIIMKMIRTIAMCFILPFYM